MTEAEIKRLLLSYDGVEMDERSTDELTIYSLDGQIVAVLKNDANPVRLSLRCDPNLAQLLRDKYESVLEGQNLNKRRFITILLTGQLTDDEVIDQIRHAYEETRKLVASDDGANSQGNNLSVRLWFLVGRFTAASSNSVIDAI